MTQIASARTIAAALLTAQGRSDVAAMVLAGQGDDLDTVQEQLAQLAPNDTSLVATPKVLLPAPAFTDKGTVANLADSVPYTWPS